MVHKVAVDYKHQDGKIESIETRAVDLRKLSSLPNSKNRYDRNVSKLALGTFPAHS